MHQLHLVQNLIKIALRVARENKAKKIGEITIVLDGDEHREPKNFENLFKNLAQGSLASGAKIKIKKGQGTYLESILID